MGEPWRVFKAQGVSCSRSCVEGIESGIAEQRPSHFQIYGMACAVTAQDCVPCSHLRFVTFMGELHAQLCEQRQGL